MRRAFLMSSSVGAVSALSGCDFIVTPDEQISVEPPPFGPLETDWPQFGYDPGNTCNPSGTTGPTGEMSIEWEIKPTVDFGPRIAVQDDLLVVTSDDTLYAFDLGAGERAWTADIESEDDTYPAAEFQPAIDEDRVYAASSNTELAAFDRANGDVLWTHEVTPRLKTPVVHGDTVYVDALVALDATDGTVRWRRDVGPRPAVADGTVFAVGDGLVALDPADGAIVWDVGPGEFDRVDVGPDVVARDGGVYVGDIKGDDAVALQRFEAADGTRDWTWHSDTAKATRARVVGSEMAYVEADDEPEVYAVDTENGGESWRWSTTFRSRPVLCDGTLFFYNGSSSGFTITSLQLPDRTETSFESGTTPSSHDARHYVVGEWVIVTGGAHVYGLRGD